MENSVKYNVGPILDYSQIYIFSSMHYYSVSRKEFPMTSLRGSEATKQSVCFMVGYARNVRFSENLPYNLSLRLYDKTFGN